jgi:Phosphotransferase enzyme family
VTSSGTMSGVAESRSENRRRRAREAALAVAAELRLDVETARILQDWNNTIIRLDPAPIVAKVGTSHFRDAQLESLEGELAVATHLATHNAPVVRPTRDPPAGPHRSQGLTLTLWRYVEAASDRPPTPQETARAITIVHRALADYSAPLPSFTAELDDAEELLRPRRSPTLAPADRRFLLGVVCELKVALPSPDAQWRPLHGSPHGANWLRTATGPLLLDFETACRGPVEWDLAALADEALALFPQADRDLIRTMRRMRSACVAAKCWVAPERAPQLREAAQVHLKLLRGQELD